MPNAAERNTLVEAFLRHAKERPDADAFISGDARLTWATAAARICAIAQDLRDLGIAAGDRVLLIASNDPETACGYFALHMLGATAAMLDDRATQADILGHRSLIDAKLVIAGNAPAGSGTVSISALGQHMTSALREPVSRPADLADILFTSGSTGTPKAVTLSQSAIIAAARQITSVIRQRPSDQELVLAPLGHSFGLGRLRSMAIAGNALVLEPSLKDPAQALLRVLQLKVTGLAQVPAGFEIMRLIGRDRLAGAADDLAYIEIGSAPISDETRAWLMRSLPRTRIYHHYGMTEASRAVFGDYKRDAAHPGTIGLATPGVEITITDSEGRNVPCGTEGELTIRGAMVMSGYFGEPPLAPGVAFRSGDLGRCDADGYLYLSGRSKDIINVGGLKVMPLEVERELQTLEVTAKLGITSFAIVGTPDPKRVTGEAVAFVYAGSTDIPSAELRGLLLPTLASYKVPTCTIRLDDIPRAASGKVLRSQLRDMVARKLANGS